MRKKIKRSTKRDKWAGNQPNTKHTNNKPTKSKKRQKTQLEAGTSSLSAYTEDRICLSKSWQISRGRPVSFVFQSRKPANKSQTIEINQHTIFASEPKHSGFRPILLLKVVTQHGSGHWNMFQEFFLSLAGLFSGNDWLFPLTYWCTHVWIDIQNNFSELLINYCVKSNHTNNDKHKVSTVQMQTSLTWLWGWKVTNFRSCHWLLQARNHKWIQMVHSSFTQPHRTAPQIRLTIQNEGYT